MNSQYLFKSTKLKNGTVNNSIECITKPTCTIGYMPCKLVTQFNMEIVHIYRSFTRYKNTPTRSEALWY